MRHFSISLDDNQVSKLDEIAKNQRRSRANLIKLIIFNYLKSEEKK